jgi:hypothetical protein
MITVNGVPHGKPYRMARKSKAEKELDSFLKDIREVEGAFHRGELSEEERDNALKLVKKVYE